MSDAAVKRNSPLELVKSVLVIPVVVAIVLGVAWGLVHWATAGRSASGKPDPRPAEVAADGSISLLIPFAKVNGEIHLGGGRHALCKIGNGPKRRSPGNSSSEAGPLHGRARLRLRLGQRGQRGAHRNRGGLSRRPFPTREERGRSNRSRPGRSTLPQRAGTNCNSCRLRYLTILSWFCGEFA